MNGVCSPALRIVHARDLGDPYRSLLRPDEPVSDGEGNTHRLPEYFYEVESWEVALKTQLTPNFALWEFMNVDVREANLLRSFPRYIPCAVSLLAGCLELFRAQVAAPVHIAANGGYRSPQHALTRGASTHCWATAVNIYRVKDEFLDTREKIERYAIVATSSMPSAWARPYGHGIGFSDDHLHIDLGYVNAASRCALHSAHEPEAP